MKVKWLVMISLACVGIIYIFFMLTKQNIETDLQPPKETVALEQTVNYPQPPPPPAPLNLVTKSASAAPAPKSAITIISKPPALEPETEVALPSINSYQGFSSGSETGNDTQPGITKIGKQPTRKEAQEMQSKGIVLY